MAVCLVAQRSYNTSIKMRSMRVFPSLDLAVKHAFDNTDASLRCLSMAWQWAFYEFAGYGEPPKRLAEKSLKANATYVLLAELSE